MLGWVRALGLFAFAGGSSIQECGFAQNCVEVCPKSLPLSNTISDVSPGVVLLQRDRGIFAIDKLS